MILAHLRSLGRSTSSCQQRFFRKHAAGLSSSTAHESPQRPGGISLTRGEAITYLENVLGIPDPINSMQHNKLEFLRTVHRRTKYVQPYTNTAILERGRYVTVGETKDLIMKKQGGGCLQINGFTKAVLDQLGYRAEFVAGEVPKRGIRIYATHVALIVYDLESPGSIHLLDPGNRQPLVELVAIDFNRVSPEYRNESNYSIRFFRESSSILRLCTTVVPEPTEGYNPHFFYAGGQAWSPATRYYLSQLASYTESESTAIRIVNDQNLLPDAHKQIVISGITTRGVITLIFGNTSVQYHKDGTADVKRFKTDQEVIENATECFPQYSPENLQKAIDYTKRFVLTNK